MQNHRYYFETKRVGGRRPHRSNPFPSNDVQHRQALKLQAMIAEVDHSIVSLDRSIEVECERSGIHDRSHYTYPMSARAMEARRNNLKITRDALAMRLSGLVGSEPTPVAA